MIGLCLCYSANVFLVSTNIERVVLITMTRSPFSKVLSFRRLEAFSFARAVNKDRVTTFVTCTEEK